MEKYITKDSRASFLIEEASVFNKIMDELDLSKIPYYSIYHEEVWELSVNYKYKETVKKKLNEILHPQEK